MRLMATTRPADVPEPASPAIMGELRNALAGAGYTAENVAAVLHLSGELTLGPADLQVHELRTRDGSRLSSLVRLFALGIEVEERAVASAVAPVKPSVLAEMGVLEVGGGKVRVVLSNEYGGTPLTIGAGSVALAGKNGALGGPAARLTWGGRSSVVVPPAG